VKMDYSEAKLENIVVKLDYNEVTLGNIVVKLVCNLDWLANRFQYDGR